jgi:hypothetical protein
MMASRETQCRGIINHPAAAKVRALLIHDFAVPPRGARAGVPGSGERGAGAAVARCRGRWAHPRSHPRARRSGTTWEATSGPAGLRARARSGSPAPRPDPKP